MLSKVSLLNLARSIGIIRQVMDESLEKGKQKTSKKFTEKERRALTAAGKLKRVKGIFQCLFLLY